MNFCKKIDIDNKIIDVILLHVRPSLMYMLEFL